MPEPTTKPFDGGEPVSGTEPDTQEPEGKPAPYLGTFATKEDAEKGLTEMQAAIGKLTGELGYLKTQSKTTEKLAEVLEKIGAPKKEESKPAVNWADLEKMWEEGDAKDQLGLLRSVLADTAARDEVAEAERRLREELAEVKRMYQEVRPDVLEHRDTVAKLREELPGADVDTLLKVAVLLDAQKPSAPPGDIPPGMTAASRVHEPEPSMTLSDAQRAMLNAAMPGGLRKGELEAYLKRKAAGRS